MTTVVVYKTGPAGPPGPAGNPGGRLSRTASTAIGGFKVVRELGGGAVALASSDDPARTDVIAGVTLCAASEGAPIDIVRQGEILDETLNLTPGPLFLGLGGAIVSEPPAHGALVRIGVASTGGRAIIDIQPPIIRA
jgi:hypothetical protein